MILPFALRRLLHRHFCRIQHIFNENPITRCGIVDENMRHRSHELAVLDDGRARHECGQERTTKFVIFFIVSVAICISSSVGNLSGSVFTLSNALYFDPAKLWYASMRIFVIF